MIRSGNWFRSPLLDQFSWLEHGFGTRAVAPATVESLATVRQIHSDVVRQAEAPGVQGDGDALITARSGLRVGVKTADCVPLLIADARRKAVAAVHAGWRGTAASIAVRAVEHLEAAYGSRRRDLWVAVGPAIGPCCFEVGGDVAVQFAAWLPECEFAAHAAKVWIDLHTANVRQLLAAGIPENQVSPSAPCTKCEPELFHSFRRDREHAGRLISWIGRLPE
jgi:YfiH family protein